MKITKSQKLKCLFGHHKLHATYEDTSMFGEMVGHRINVVCNHCNTFLAYGKRSILRKYYKQLTEEIVNWINTYNKLPSNVTFYKNKEEK